MTIRKTKRAKYSPDIIYIVTAKFEMLGSEVEQFIPRLKRANVYWIEQKLNNQRKEPI